METGLPNNDPEIIKLDGLIFKDKQEGVDRLRRSAGLYNADDGYIIYMADGIKTKIQIPVNTNRYLFSTKVTFKIPIYELKPKMDVSGTKNVEYTIYVTPRIVSLKFVEVRNTKEYYFELIIGTDYHMYNPGAGQPTRTFNIKGFRNPAVSITAYPGVNNTAYIYRTFSLTLKETIFNRSASSIQTVDTDPNSTSNTTQFDSFSPLTMGDDHLNFEIINSKSRQSNGKERIVHFFKKKGKDTDGNMS